MQLSTTITIPSFENLARDWHLRNSSSWVSHHSDRVLKRLESNVFQFIGHLPVNTIRPPHLVAVIQAAETRGADLTRRILQYMTRIFNLARCYGYINDNPAIPLKELLIAKKTTHRPALPLKQLNYFFAQVEKIKIKEVERLAFYINLHTFVRSSELRNARWCEIDFENKLWTIPAERPANRHVRFSHRGSKMRTEHLVPLSEFTFKCFVRLKEIALQNHKNGFIFSIDKIRPISENAMNSLLRKAGFDTKTEVCAHGFRTMACSALNESNQFSVNAIEKQMSHQERNSVRAAYIHQAEYIYERKDIMEWWSNYLENSRNNLKFIHPYEFTRGVK